MKQSLFLLTILLVSAALCAAQSASQASGQQNSPPSSKQSNHVTITGCLTKNPHDEYDLVDQNGIHNLVYKSDKFDLDSYVGQSVTLVGDRSAIPSRDTGTARPMPHFRVRELRPGSGKCQK